MTNFPRPTQPDSPLWPQLQLPTMYDLPSENPEEIRLPDEYHTDLSQLLRLTFKPPLWNPEQVFCAIELNIYYDLDHPLWYKRPDWFGVVGVPRLYEGRELRESYVMWIEQVSPLVIVEFLSPSTENEDLGRSVGQPGKPPTKWHVYEQILRVPYYVLFSRYTNQLQAFHLIEGDYEPAELTNGRLLIPEAGLSIGLWQGSHEGVNRLWLRWFTELGLIPTPNERALIAQQQAASAEQRATSAEEKAASAEQRATTAEEKAERLSTKLRELGINPDQLG